MASTVICLGIAYIVAILAAEIVRCPLARAHPYGDRFLRKDGDTVMIYTLRDLNATWLQKLRISLERNIDADWLVEEGAEADRREYERLEGTYRWKYQPI
jgi:hypothetical protein